MIPTSAAARISNGNFTEKKSPVGWPSTGLIMSPSKRPSSPNKLTSIFLLSPATANIWTSKGDAILEPGPGLFIWIAAKVNPGGAVGVSDGADVGGIDVDVSEGTIVGVIPAETVALMD